MLRTWKLSRGNQLLYSMLFALNKCKECCQNRKSQNTQQPWDMRCQGRVHRGQGRWPELVKEECSMQQGKRRKSSINKGIETWICMMNLKIFNSLFVPIVRGSGISLAHQLNNKWVDMGPDRGSQEPLKTTVSAACLGTELKHPLSLMIHIHFMFLLSKRDCLYIAGPGSMLKSSNEIVERNSGKDQPKK